MVCSWCRIEISAAVRSDARFCSQRCRQASHRFTRLAVARARCGTSMRFAYADPPYPGRARLYRDHPDFAGEVDHHRLVEQLTTGYPDGWALSTDARSLPFVLSCLAGVDVSVAAWFRRRRPHATAARPVSSWEPVVFAGGRQLSPSSTSDVSCVDRVDVSCTDPGDASGGELDVSCGDRRDVSRLQRFDALICRSGPRTTDPGRVIGTKPAAFAYWIFDLLGARPGDELDDLFPGSGGIGRAWAHYSSLEYSCDASCGAAADR